MPVAAIEHVNLAIDMFRSENNTIGTVYSSSTLARIYNELANPGKSLLILKASDEGFQKIDAYSVQL